MGSQLCRVFPVGLRLKKRRKMFCPKIFIIYCVMSFIRTRPISDEKNILQKIEKIELGLQECKANLQVVTENIQHIESTVNMTNDKFESLGLNVEENKKEINRLKYEVNTLE